MMQVKRIVLKMWKLLFLILFCSFYKCEIINDDVLRKIQINSQLIEMENTIFLKNLGLDSADSFIYLIDPDVSSFYVEFKNELDKELVFKEINVTSYKVFFEQPLLPKSKYKVKVLVVYIDKIAPLYKKMSFVQDQLVIYKGNLLYYSPYKTNAMRTIYKLEIKEDIILSHTPYLSEDKSITFFNRSVNPYSFEPLHIIYKDNRQFLVVNNLERIIDISHYGKIYIEDRVSIKNEGSKLVGPYEQKNSSIEVMQSGWWYTYLPAAAEYIQFYDELGNNSKSNILHMNNYKTLKFRPRYPLLNGWKTFYIVKYCVPTYEYLYHEKNGKFVLKFRIVDHVLNDAVIRKAVTKVLLPEGATVVKVDVPYGFIRLRDERSFTLLSTFGRPTLSFFGDNILQHHIDVLNVEYKYSMIFLIRAPLLITLYVASLFVAFLVVTYYK